MQAGKLIGPELASLLEGQADLFLDDGIAAARIRSAQIHPGFKVSDDRSGQLALRRHLHFVAVTQRLDQQAFLGIVGHDGRARVAAGLPAVSAVQKQAALQPLLALSFLRVAFVAVLDQHGPDFLFKENDGLVTEDSGRFIGGNGRQHGPAPDRQQQQQQEKRMRSHRSPIEVTERNYEPIELCLWES
jgi:hypothetical protein